VPLAWYKRWIITRLRRHVCLAALGLGVLAPGVAHAAVLSPTTDSDQLDGAAPCSLREAVQSANLDSDQGGCTHSGTYGAPADTINLLAGHTYTLALAGEDDLNAVGDLDIFGNTAGPKDGNLIINGNGATIDGNGAVTGDRVLNILRPDNSWPALTVTMDAVTVTGGTAPATGFLQGFGAGMTIFNNQGSVSISNSTISGNHGANDGGGIANGQGTMTLSKVTVSGNTAKRGAGVFSGDTSNLNNVTISGNDADSDGGGLFAGNGFTSLSNVTISDNTADADAGGADAGNGGGMSTDVGAITARNSIIAGNADLSAAPTFAPDCGPWSPVAGTGTFTFTAPNLIGDTTGCTFTGTGNIVNVPAGLGTLGANGGPTQTHALLVGSPAIDAGDPGSCQTTDQRGVARPQGARCDLGAFEFVPGVPTVPATAATPALRRKKCKKGRRLKKGRCVKKKHRKK
jgi:CSLREA domain-containing protein